MCCLHRFTSSLNAHLVKLSHLSHITCHLCVAGLNLPVEARGGFVLCCPRPVDRGQEPLCQRGCNDDIQLTAVDQHLNMAQRGNEGLFSPRQENTTAADYPTSLSPCSCPSTPPATVWCSSWHPAEGASPPRSHHGTSGSPHEWHVLPLGGSRTERNTPGLQAPITHTHTRNVCGSGNYCLHFQLIFMFKIFLLSCESCCCS